MIVVLPIFPVDETEQRLLVESVNGTSLCASALSAVCGLPSSEVFVVTDEPEVVQRLARHRLQCLLVTETRTFDDEPLFPPGTQQSFDAVFEALGTQNCGDVLVVDYRNVHLNRQAVEDALDEYYETPAKAVIGVSKPADHPTQLFHDQRVVEVEHLHLLESADDSVRLLDAAGRPAALGDRGTRNWRVARPGYFDWETYGVCAVGDSKLYARIGKSERPRMIGAREVDRLTAPPEIADGAWWICDGPHLGRRVFDADRLIASDGSELSGLSAPSRTGSPGAFVARASENGELEIFLRCHELGSEPLIRVWATSRDCLDKRFAEMEIAPGAANANHRKGLRVGQTEFVGPVTTLQDFQSSDGLLVALVDGPIDGADTLSVDFCDPLEIFEGLWNVDSDTGEVLSGAFRRPIVGRQDFPAVFALNPAFVILDARARAELGDAIERGEVAGIPLADFAASKVRNDFDLVQSLARFGDVQP